MGPLRLWMVFSTQPTSIHLRPFTNQWNMTPLPGSSHSIRIAACGHLILYADGTKYADVAIWDSLNCSLCCEKQNQHEAKKSMD